MTHNFIALAIPFFLVAMAVELVAARVQRRSLYRLQDALADLGCGVSQQVALVVGGVVLLVGYEWLYQHATLVRFAPDSPWPWVIAFVVVDLAYYWWHRLSHEVGFLWAVHAVHHQSEDYNLAVALRQAVLSSFTSLPFYAVMAFVGVPTVVYVTMVSVSTLYQFWIHTELVGKLGKLDLVLNTPSHHRVHHAVNPRYLDKNYGAIFIVWDRLFGSFAEERERPVYGVTKPIRSFNPLWAQLEAWVELARRGRTYQGLDRLRVFWKSPAWTPRGKVAPSEADLVARPKHESPASLGVAVYALVQYVPLVAATFLMLLWQPTASPRALAVAAVLVFWTLLGVGGLLDGRRWAVPVEVARLMAVAAAVLAWVPAQGLEGAARVATPVLALVLGVWLLVAARRRVVAP